MSLPQHLASRCTCPDVTAMLPAPRDLEAWGATISCKVSVLQTLSEQ